MVSRATVSSGGKNNHKSTRGERSNGPDFNKVNFVQLFKIYVCQSGNKLTHKISCITFIGRDLRGELEKSAFLSVQLISFSNRLWQKILPNNRLAHPHLGNPGSTTDFDDYSNKTGQVLAVGLSNGTPNSNSTPELCQICVNISTRCNYLKKVKLLNYALVKRNLT